MSIKSELIKFMPNKILTGLCACPGEVDGVIKIYEPGQLYVKTDIIILNQWITQNVVALKDVGGLLSSSGGLTCHASIIAREFNLPCLISVKGLEGLTNGARVHLDAAAEEIIVYE